ncbi:MAG: hypothetical protein AABO58_09895 [Acidobacteriota bacterium]
MNSPKIGRRRSAPPSSQSLSRTLPKLRLPSALAKSTPRRRPQVGKPSPVTTVRARDERK